MADLTGNPAAAVDLVMPDINTDGSTPASPVEMNTRYQQLLDNDARLDAKAASVGSAPTIAQETTLDVAFQATETAPAGVFYFFWGGTGDTPDEADLLVEALINGTWRRHPHRFWQLADAGYSAGLIVSTGANIRFSHGGGATQTVRLTRIALASL